MKSKVFVEVLRSQIDASLITLSNHFKVEYTLSENDNINETVDGKQIKVYGLMIELDTVVDNQPFNRKLYYRRYEIKGSLNDIKAQAYSELMTVMTGAFLIQATKSDDSTLEKLSKTRVIE